MNPSVSVIIPVYNRLESLKQVVESVIAQTLPAREIIVVDDGSTDETPQALPAYIASKADWRDRVRYFYQENQGQSVAFNTGIEKASGDWLAFTADDDPWLPRKLEWQFRALESFPPSCKVCFTDAWFMNNPQLKQTVFQIAGKEHSEMTGLIPDPLSYILEKFNARGIHSVWVQTLVASASLVRQLGGFDPELRYAEDEEFVFRLACSKASFCFVSIPLVLIERTPGERHVGVARNFENELFQLRMNRYRFEKRLSMASDLPKQVRRSARQSLKSVYSRYANFYLAAGEYRKARAALSTAAGYALTPGLAAKWIMSWTVPKLASHLVSQRSQSRASGPAGNH